MAWEIVKIPTDIRGRTASYASVGHGKLALSAAACALIHDYDAFSHVLLRRNRMNNRLCIGVQFLKESTVDAIKISRKKTANGKFVGGIDISCKKVLENLFGLAATANTITRYDVKIDDSFENFLVVFAE